MKKEYEIIIIGAGASGMMVAANLDNKAGVLVLDANDRAGMKISISGGGKCNLTNESVASANYIGDDRFISRSFKGFDNVKTKEWFESRGLLLESRKNGQYFCVNKASDVVQILQAECHGVEFMYGCKVDMVSSNEDSFVVRSSIGDFKSKVLVVASGGLSYSKIGASGVGYKVAELFGHDVEHLSPSLVGLSLGDKYDALKELSGSSVSVEIRVGKKKITGDLLFTHKGMSGPAILDASLYWQGEEIVINFLKDFDLREMRGANALVSSVLPLPKKIAKSLLFTMGVEDTSVKSLSSNDMKKIESLKEYSIVPSGTFGYSRAEVTRGGVYTGQLEQKSMMSKKVKNLYFVGEVLNVTGELGGYNFQWAFTSGYLCAKNLNRWRIDE